MSSLTKDLGRAFKAAEDKHGAPPKDETPVAAIKKELYGEYGALIAACFPEMMDNLRANSGLYSRLLTMQYHPSSSSLISEATAGASVSAHTLSRSSKMTAMFKRALVDFPRIDALKLQGAGEFASFTAVESLQDALHNAIEETTRVFLEPVLNLVVKNNGLPDDLKDLDTLLQLLEPLRPVPEFLSTRHMGYFSEYAKREPGVKTPIEIVQVEERWLLKVNDENILAIMKNAKAPKTPVRGCPAHMVEGAIEEVVAWSHETFVVPGLKALCEWNPLS